MKKGMRSMKKMKMRMRMTLIFPIKLLSILVVNLRCEIPKVLSSTTPLLPSPHNANSAPPPPKLT
jgi:hypothetical protein